MATFGIPPYPPLQQPGGPPSTSTKVEINVSCKDLIDQDVLSKSDPMCVLFTEERTNQGKTWKEYGRTEVIKDSLNPQFVTPFKINFNFEQHQNLKFGIYDVDSKSNSLNDHDFLGSVTISLGSLMGEHCGTITKRLVKEKVELSATISLIAEEMSESKEVAQLQFECKTLDKKDMFGGSDPFLIIYRHAVEEKKYMPVHKTEVIMNNLNPTWKSFEIPLTSLCNGDRFRPIKIECYDWDSDGSHDLIGSCEVNLEDMLSKTNFPKELINEKKKKKKSSYKNSGVLYLNKCEVYKDSSFLDYIVGGIELCFHVAIDFTASNGVPTNQTSLHYIRPDAPNQYMQALLAVGKICEDYDSDKLMPAYGFGARIQGTVYHDFHLNQSVNPDCFGVMGIVEAYHRFLPTAQLYGPTNFSPIINLVTKVAQSEKDGSITKKYHVLLILTDGVITDMDMTKLAIINAAALPISIIIVGVGNADFGSMDELDADGGSLKYGGKEASRDIVQFVPFNKFRGFYASDHLAEEVLREVPNQLVKYMKSHGIKPQPPKPFSYQLPPQAGPYPNQPPHGFNPGQQNVASNQTSLEPAFSSMQVGGMQSYPNQLPPPSQNAGSGSLPYPAVNALP